MKKLIIVLGILVAANVLIAQDSEWLEERIESRRQAINDRLDLTDEQFEQLKELREKYRPEIQSIRTDESKTRSEKMRAVADLVDEKNSDLTGILSQNQMAELTVLRKEMQAKRKLHREKMRRNRMKQRRSHRK
ncbi:MAG: hypothetical protein ABJG78_08580 [Cyclobacteriaceae bacterium]